MSHSITTPLTANAPRAGLLMNAPLAIAMPVISLSFGNAGSSFVKCAAKSAEQDGWQAVSSTSPIASGYRFAATAPDRMTKAIETEAPKEARTDDASMGLIYEHAPSFAVLASFLMVCGAISIAGILDFLKRRINKAKETGEVDPHARPTVSVERHEALDAERPTVAATPEAMKKKPSLGVKVGGESVPGFSIIPPPEKRGGSNIE